MRGILCAFFGGVFWGFSANCAEVLMGTFGVPVEWITCMRMAFSALFFVALTLVTNRRKLVEALHDAKSLLAILGFSILGILLTQVSYLKAIHSAGAGTALLLEQLGLVLIMLYLCAKGRRLPIRREFLGLVFALVGTVLIATQGQLTVLNIPVEGLVWGLISAVALAFYNLFPVKPLAKYGSFLVTGLAMLIGCVCAVVMFQPWNYDVRLPVEGWAVFAAIVVVGTILAYMLFIQGIKDAGPMRASLLGSVEPISAMVISAVWLGTPISVFDAFGAAAIVAMIALVTEREAPASKDGAEGDAGRGDDEGRGSDEGCGGGENRGSAEVEGRGAEGALSDVARDGGCLPPDPVSRS